MTIVADEAVPTPLFDIAIGAMNDLRNQVPDFERITDDEQGLIAAFGVAMRADCTRRRVGAVLVNGLGRVVGTGRNGAPPGRPGCLSAGACPRGRLTSAEVAPGSTYSHGAGLCTALHAEVNCVLHAGGTPTERQGGVIYITDAPCDDCSKFLAGTGLARAVWPENVEGRWVVRTFDLSGPVGRHYV